MRAQPAAARKKILFTSFPALAHRHALRTLGRASFPTPTVPNAGTLGAVVSPSAQADLKVCPASRPLRGREARDRKHKVPHSYSAADDNAASLTEFGMTNEFKEQRAPARSTPTNQNQVCWGPRVGAV